MKYKLKKAFTMIELMVSVVVGTLIMFGAFQFMSSTRFNFMHGTINLQNLQDIRLAINFLRRDFSSSCPYIAPNESIKDMFELRRKPFNTTFWADPLKSKLIQITNNALLFYRFKFDSQDGVDSPQVVEVNYTYNPTTKTLTRLFEGKSTIFKGFEDVEFKIYMDEYNGRVPILWVRFLAHEGKDMGAAAGGGKKDLGQPLELTTSIVSQFMNNFYSNKFWNFDTPHKK